MSKQPLLVLVDGSAVFHRGYHAIPHLSNKDGEPTNAVYGFLMIMIKVLGDLKPDYVVVAWDKSSKTFRNDMYADYKATRKKMDDELRVQIEPTKELVHALGIPFIEVENYEADDIIGTLARKAEARGDLGVVIATGDRDQLQLVDQKTVVDMFNPRGMEPTRYDLAKMREKYGLTPAQFIDYKALVGDTSDNIPGVSGIGDKGAQKLLAQYQTLDGIYEHVDEIAGSVGEKLRAGKEMAYLSRKLSVIVCDMDVDLDLEAARVGQYRRDELDELFRRFDFRHGLLAKLPGAPTVAEAKTAAAPTLFGDEVVGAEKERTHLVSAKYHSVTTQAELDELVKNLSAQTCFAFDTETTSVNTMVAELVGLSVSWREGEAYYVPVGHAAGTQLARDDVTSALKPIFENASIGKVGHNLKFDYEVLARSGLQVQGIAFDTMVAAFLLNSLGRAQSLDDLAFHELGIEMIPIKDLIGSGKNEITFDKTLIDQATTYAAEDADMSWRLYARLRGQLGAFNKLNERGWSMERLAEEVEWPLIAVLGDMELRGIELDIGALAKFGHQLGTGLANLRGRSTSLRARSLIWAARHSWGKFYMAGWGLRPQVLRKERPAGQRRPAS